MSIEFLLLKEREHYLGGKILENQLLGVVVADASNPPYRKNLGLMFDSIITDPPYGIREPAEKVGTKRREYPDDYKIPEEYLPLHFPQKITTVSLSTFSLVFQTVKESLCVVKCREKSNKLLFTKW